jgi:hypothetical protein
VGDCLACYSLIRQGKLKIYVEGLHAHPTAAHFLAH